MTPREGVSVDDPAEREAFAAHMRKRHAYEYVYWNGAGQPSAKRPDTPYGEGWVPCDEQWAAWLGRASLAHPAATAREEAFYEAALAYFESDKARMAAFTGEVFIEGPESAAIAEAGKRLGAARAAYAALALARLVKGTEA